MANWTGMSIDPLWDLLDFLAEPLRKAHDEKVCENKRTAKSFSALAYFQNDETKQTEIIASLLSPSGRHDQGSLFLRHLLTNVWPSIHANAWSDKDLQRARVYPNHCIPFDTETGERARFIDLWIQVGDFCLAMESKAKGAADQPGQIAAYLQYMERTRSAFRNYKLLYLSHDGEKPCKDSILPDEWDKACHDGVVEVQPYTSFVRRWLTTCKEECGAERIKFFIDDLIAFVDTEDRRTISMTPEMNSTVRSLLCSQPADSPLKARRNALLSIWELSDGIFDELLNTFQSNLCARLSQMQLKYKIADWDGKEDHAWGMNQEWGRIQISGEHRSTYAAIQRCPPNSHRNQWPHLIIGISIEGLDKGELRRWRDRARLSSLGAGTGDPYWVWQEIPEGFEDLRSKDTAIRLLDPKSADDIIVRVRDVLETLVEIARSMEPGARI